MGSGNPGAGSLSGHTESPPPAGAVHGWRGTSVSRIHGADHWIREYQSARAVPPGRTAVAESLRDPSTIR